MELRGSTVVVTGGSQGIGKEIAKGFAEAGSRVLVAARSTDKLVDVAAEIGGEHLTVDLLDAEQVDSFIPTCLARLGRIDVLVNNAGLETADAFAAVDRTTVRDVARLNFEAPLLLSRDVLPHMIDRGTGHIVQMSSVAGAIGFPSLAAYSGTKAGLTNFTEALRLEIARSGIGLTVVSPGPVDTDMWWRLENDDAPFAAPALKRFSRLGFLPKLAPEAVAAATVKAVAENKRTVRLPARFNGYHALNNAPRRMVSLALTGVKFPK